MKKEHESIFILQENNNRRLLVERCKAEHCETQSGLIKHHETVYRSTKLILNK